MPPDYLGLVAEPRDICRGSRNGSESRRTRQATFSPEIEAAPHSLLPTCRSDHGLWTPDSDKASNQIPDLCGMELRPHLVITRGEWNSWLGKSFDPVLGHQIENLKGTAPPVASNIVLDFEFHSRDLRRNFHLEFCAGCSEPHSDRPAAIRYKLINEFVRVRSVTGRVFDTARLPSNHCGWMPSGGY